MLMISPRPGVRPLAFAAAGLFALALAGCASDEAPSNASPFGQALARDYVDLASQAAAAPAPESDESFFENPFGLFGSPPNPNDLLVTAFNDKADLARQGQEPAPEAAPGNNADAVNLHDRLVRAVAAGKDRFPEQAARAQADYDCWVLDNNVGAMIPAAQACRSAFDASLLALENAARPAPRPAPVFVPPPAPPPPPAPSAFVALFDFDSWTLTAEDLTVITDAINTARTGGQTHIAVVGHTDTSGSADYNQKLSVRRANVVVEAMVDMGARRAAIQASGVGETDLAVQTPDNTKEARNRRTVIDLIP
jgi:outer membrane protein OmpA-like peptidoglycan-associated protein